MRKWKNLLLSGLCGRTASEGKWILRAVWIVLFSGWLFFPSKVYASSGVVQFMASADEVEKGNEVTVVCQVTSDVPFLDVAMSVRYDERYVTFLQGGNKVSGGGGILQISSSGNTEETYKKTFALQFRAKKKGTAVFGLREQAKVTDADGNEFSTSSNSVAVRIRKKGSSPVTVPDVSGLPKATSEPVQSKENRLKMLEAHCLTFSPSFSPKEKEYNVTVDARTEHLYIRYTPKDEKARVTVKEKQQLMTGDNEVIVLVTAENGAERRYRLHVRKESEQETKKREQEETGQGDVKAMDTLFSVKQKGNRVILQNAYQFEVLDPSCLSQVPAGYIQSNITLQGIKVPAFTMEKDLENNYLLLYLKGPTGNSTLYQYDREERTLQRYTGNMTERVNRGNIGEDTGSFPLSNAVLTGIIVVLVVLVLSLLIAMLKMATRRREIT